MKKTGVKRLHFLQQVKRDPWKLIFCLGTVVVFAIFIAGILPLYSRGNVHGGLIGIVVGMLFTYRHSSISQIKLTENQQAFIPVLKKYRYQKTDKGYYTPPGPEILKFRSQRIYLDRQSEDVVVTGPWYVLQKIQKAHP